MNYFSLIFGSDTEAHAKPFSYAGPPRHQESFPAYFEEHLKPLIKHAEKIRLAQLKILRQRARVSMVIAVVALIAGLIYISHNQFNLFIVFIFIFLCAALGGWCNRAIKMYNSGIKNSIFPKIVGFLGEEFEFTEQSPWDLKKLKPFGILPSYNRSSTEDYIKGSYKGVDIELMESLLEKVTRDSKGRETRRTLFKGLFIKLEMHKAFNGKTIVTRDKGTLGNWFGKSIGRLENVALEDPTFEKTFQVYSNDQIEARYLLTTTFMERLLLLCDIFGSKNVQCSFYQNSVLFMISSKHNRFEPGSIEQALTLEHEVNTVFNELEEIFSIIDALKLSENHGL